MKLNELIGIKSLPKPENPKVINQQDRTVNREIHDFLTKGGFEPIANGLYGSTYRSRDIVLKVYSDDPAYESWLNFIKGVDSIYKPFVPKIKLSRPYIPEPRIKFVAMELLRPIDYRKWEEFSANADLAYAPLDLDDEYIDLPKLKREIQNSGLTYYEKYLKNFNELLFNFIRVVVREAKNRGFYPDLNDENVMTRNNVVVLTDPWRK